MAPLHPAIRSRVVGALSCQRYSYLRTLETEVVSCIKLSSQRADQLVTKSTTKAAKASTEIEPSSASPLWLIEFVDSVFFPEGGGQPSDHGTITPLANPSPKPIPITFVERQGLHCVFHSPKALPPGTLVRQDVDFQRRWDHMQQHTGQHLLSAIMEKYYKLETLGWGMGVGNGMSYVDVPRKPSEDEMQSIQEKCNDVIQQNIGITVTGSDNAKLDKLPDDYDKEKGVIRVVSIGNLDANTCCGTHLRQTSHISLLLLGSTQSVHSTRCRLSFIVGDRAIGLATSAIRSVRSVARLLSLENTPAEVLAGVSSLKESVTKSKKEETKLLTDIANYEADRVKAVLSNGSNAFVHRAVQDLDFINMVVTQVKGAIKQGAVIILASGEGTKGGQVIILGDKNSIEGLVTKVKEVIPGIKGGGRGERWQGKVVEWRKGDIEALKKLIGCYCAYGLGKILR